MALPPRADMSEPLQIYQDPFFNQASPMISHAPMPSVTKPPQRRIMQAIPNSTNANNGSGSNSSSNSNNSIIHNHKHSSSLSSNNGNIVINPPIQPAIQLAMAHSPTKMPRAMMANPPPSPLRASQHNMLNSVTFNPPMDRTKPTDSIQKKQPLMSRFQTVAQRPPVDMGSMAAFMGKENSHPIIFPAPPGLNLSIENYYQKAPGKRLLEPAPIKDGRPLKRQRVDEGPLPPHDSFPPIVDDGLKPGHSYAMLIGMAILRSPGRKLTLSQIYKWISDTYSFYNPQDAGWQNSIRHNLSLNKAFVKQERPKDDPGKGNYWAIEPGMEYSFMKDKSIRKPLGAGDNLQVMSTTVLEPSLPPMPTSFQEPALPAQLPPMPSGVPESSSAPSAVAHSTRQPELSSDATIIVSETGAPEDQQPSAHGGCGVAGEEKGSLPVAGRDAADGSAVDLSQFSPVPATALHSSPPIARHIEAHSGTPPPVPRALLASSVQRSRKRKSASMDDSGYISSLESSALRSNQNTRHLAETGDRSRIKRGRAEEEIARLRASSYDSPTKGRYRSGYHPASSSPLRHSNHNENASSRMPPPPLTPAVKLKAPMKPPPSVSPGTNLRIHRDRVRHMLASPWKRIASSTDDVPGWGSPTGGFDESLYNFAEDADFTLDTTNLGNTFEIFQDDSLPNLFPAVHNGSPIKAPSSKRLRLDRSYSASALSEVTNSAARRNITSAPFLKVPTQSPGLSLDTPSKIFDGLASSPSKFLDLPSPSKQPRHGNGAVPGSGAGLGDENTWVPLDDFCAPGFLQEVDELNGLDILQGFEKIGSNIQPQQLFSVPPQPRLMPYQQTHQQYQQQPQGRQGRGGQKPILGRSYSSAL